MTRALYGFMFGFLRLAAPIVLWSVAAPSPARELPSAPQLCIEAGMHTAAIRCISTDRTGRLALTVSDDKTARLWELLSGRLLHVLRPPLGKGDEGKLFAGALSPDGTLAAVGGHTVELDGKESIYLFDTATGQLVRQLDGLPDVICDLAFSESGHWLAAGLFGGNGIRLWEMTSGREVAADMAYGAECCRLSWHGDTRLATSCVDGKVRLYCWAEAERPPRALSPSRTTRTQEGKQPLALCFSPEGRRLAVGFDDSTKVAVLSGEDLSLLFVPDTSGVDNGNLGSVAWSADGTTLAAGGRWQRNDDAVPLRLWAESGRGQGRDVAVATSTISDLCPLPDGRLLYSAHDPAWGVVELASGGQLTRYGAPPIAEYRSNLKGFRLSASANVVAFGFAPFGKNPATFDLAKRALTLLPEGQSLPATLHPPRLKGLPITGWNGTTAPQLRVQALKLKPNEWSCSLAIAPDAASFLLGTEFYLRCFSAYGTESWKMRPPSVVWNVNFSADGRLAVAAYGDGTIRWHRADTGQELLAFFPHADQRRWVLWAPLYEAKQLASVDIYLVNQELAKLVRRFDLHAFISIGGIPVNEEWNTELVTSMLNKAKPGESIWVEFVKDGRTRKVAIPLPPQIELIAKGVYYDCSPGAEDLIGWHVNHGRDQAADFFPISRFRNVFYRPDVISRVLQYRDVAEALRMADRDGKLPETKPEDIATIIARLSPPVVELVTGGVLGTVTLPAEAEQLSVRYRVRQTGQKAAKKVTFRFNGRLLDLDPKIDPNTLLPKGAEGIEVNLRLPAGMAGELSVFASHDLAVSEAAVLRVERQPGGAPPRKPDLHVLAVGVDNLKMNDLSDNTLYRNLAHPAADAQNLVAALKLQEGRAFGHVFVTPLVEREKLTALALRAALTEFARQVRQPEDVAMVFFSGHGALDPELGYYLFTYETDPKAVAATALTGKELSDLLEGIKARTVLVLDTCHAAGALGGSGIKRVVTGPRDLTYLINSLSSAEQGTVVLSSSAATEESLEDPKGGGLFAQALREALSDETLAGADRRVTCRKLPEWLARRLPELVAALPREGSDKPLRQQTAVCVIPKGVPDFALSTP